MSEITRWSNEKKVWMKRREQMKEELNWRRTEYALDLEVNNKTDRKRTGSR
jgi:hypothetical protein